MPIHTFHDELIGVSTSGTVFDQKTEKYPDNRLMCLQHVCAVNHDKNNARVNVGFVTGGQIMWLGDIICASDGIYYSKTFPTWFQSPRNIIARWTAINSGDRVEVYVYGYYKE